MQGYENGYRSQQEQLAQSAKLVLQEHIAAGASPDQLKNMVEGLRNSGKYPTLDAILSELGMTDYLGKPLPIITLEALLAKMLPEARWAVPGLISEGLSILGGKPKLGKSWLALGLAIAIAGGGQALGRISVERGDVLYLALEDNERRLQRRARQVLSSLSTTPAGLHLATEWPRMGMGGLELLRQWVSAHPCARFIIIDTWAKFKPRATGGQRSQYDEDYDAGSPLKALADEYGIAIMVVTHMRKLGSTDILDEIAGSIGFTGVADGILGLKRERGQFDATLFVTGRDVEEETEYGLSFDKQFATWTLQGNYEEVARTKERQAILDLLREAARGMTGREIAELLGGKNIYTTRNHLAAMVKDKTLVLKGYTYFARMTSEASQLLQNQLVEQS